MNIIQKTMQIKRIDEDTRTLEGLVSTEALDRDGDTVKVAGIDTKGYMQNPVLLRGHSHDQPIDRAIELAVTPDGLFGKFKLLSEGVSEAADEAYKMAKEKVLRSFSIGFLPVEYESLETGWDIIKSELLEISLVAVPSNRQSLITEVKEFEMSDEIETTETETDETQTTETKATKPVQSPFINPTPHNGQYSLTKLIQSAIQSDLDSGFEKEISREIKSKQPWRKYNGFAVPDIAFNQKAMAAYNQKASGTGSGQNMADLIGVDRQDGLFTRTDAGITNDLLFDRIEGVTNLTGLTEKTVTIPVQNAQCSADYIAEDGTFHSSSAPAFTTADLSPKLVTALATLNLSAVFAQHPQLGTPDFIAAELRRAMSQEINRAFIVGDNDTNNEEPDGLLYQATDSTASPSATPLAIAAATFASLVSIPQQVEDYLQQEIGGTYILHPAFIDALATQLKFTGSVEAAVKLSEKMIAGKNVLRGIGLPITDTTVDNAPTFFVGDASTIVTGQWFGYDLLINPYADAVYSKGNVYVRLHTFNDLLLVDPKRVLKFVTNVATA